jgi:glycerophosphoryl diester phosphodiesterase
MPPLFDLQGHRGARGLRPENTLPSFEAALDAGATSIETDLHLTRDGVVVLCHDPFLSEPLFSRARPGAPDLATGPAVRSLSLAELRCYRAAGNPSPAAFPEQRPEVGPAAQLFAAASGLDAFCVPTLADLFAFAAAYAGELGRQAGKSDAQRRRAARVAFDLELKRVPFYPEAIGDRYTGAGPALLEEQVVEAVAAAGVVRRTTVRSFDHRCVRALRHEEPRLAGAVLVAHTDLVPEEMLCAADAQVYCPDYRFLEEEAVWRVHREGARVVPYTVNEAGAWARLLDMGVDGICTDYPDRLAGFLRERGENWAVP